MQSHDTAGPLAAFKAQYAKSAAVTIAGTGSAGFEKRMVGGLGHFLGERGCGFSAVMNAIQRICAIKDGFQRSYGDYGSLWEDFCKFFGFPGEGYQDSGILNLFYGEQFKNKVASFNREMVSNQSPLVKQVYMEEFHFIAEMIQILDKECAFSDVICVGGFWSSMKIQTEARDAFLKELTGKKFWAISEVGGAVGAALDASGTGWKGESLFAEFF